MEKNTKIITASIILVIILFIGVVIANSLVNNDNKSNLNETITIIDQRGEEVTIPKDVKRIVAIPKPSASLLYTLDGSSERIVGVHPSAMSTIKNGILGEIDPSFKNVSTGFVKSGFEPNVEEVLKLHPDVVIQWGDRGDDIIKPLEDAGIPTVGIVFGDFENTTRIYGQILGKEERAEELINYYSQKKEEIEEKTSQIPDSEKPRVLNVYMSNDGKLGLRGFDWINLSGGINVAEDLRTYGDTVNMEQVQVWNPDIIYIFESDGFTPAKILNNEIEGQDWSKINAVNNSRVYAIPEGAHWWGPPNQEIPLMWEWLVEIQYPDLFDYDLRQDLKDFYSEFYDYQLSEDQVDKILHCDLNKGLGLSCCNRSD